MTDLVRAHGNPVHRWQADSDLLPIYLQRFDRAQTRRAYESDIRSFFAEAIGAQTITLEVAMRVSFIEVNQHVQYLQDLKRKGTTIQRRLAALRGFFAWLIALGLLERNPADRHVVRKVRTSSYRDRPIVFLDKPSARRLLEAAKTPKRAGVRNHAMLTVMLRCVLRRSEVAAMDAEHIRPAGPYWALDLPTTKGGADQFVKIPADVVELIEEHKRHYDIVSGPLWRSLSNNNRGGRLNPQSVYAIVQRAAADAELNQQIGAHTLRHTGCTLAIESGATLQQVKDHARHKNVETTLVYVHQRDRLKNSAADYINL